MHVILFILSCTTRAIYTVFHVLKHTYIFSHSYETCYFSFASDLASFPLLIACPCPKDSHYQYLTPVSHHSILPTVVDIVIAVVYFTAAFNYWFGIIVFITMASYLGKKWCIADDDFLTL